MKNIKVSFFAVMILFILAACSPVEEGTPEPIPEQPTKGIAEVESIEILRLAENPDQVRVAAHFQLPDLCTSLDNVDVQRTENAFRITVTTIKEGGTACAEKAVDVERLIPLGESGLPPGSYAVVVNDTSSRFELAAGSTPVAASQEVTEKSEEASVETEAEVEPEEEVDSGNLADTSSEEQEQSEDNQDEPEEAGLGEPAGETETVADPAVCQEKVGFFGDVTVPDDMFFRQGETFTKIWKLRNEGTCTWDADYSLVFAGGHILNAPLTVPLSLQVAPGEIFELSLDMAAPFQGGTYISKWLFQNPQGEQFGMGASRKDVIYTRIVVGWIDSDGTSGESDASENGAAQSGTADCAVEQDASVEQVILELINRERIDRGLRRLASEDRLTSAARRHSADMACNNFTDHTGSDRSTMKSRVEREGYTPSYVAENIYYGGTAQDAFDWWMDSQVHKDNILNANVTEIGIGYVSYTPSRWSRYYTLVFSRP